MKKISFSTIIGVIIGIIILVIIDPDFGWIKKIYIVPKEIFKEQSESKNPTRDYSQNFDKAVVEKSIIGIPRLNSNVKNYKMVIKNYDSEDIQKTILYNFSETGNLISKQVNFADGKGNIENIQYKSEAIELISTFDLDSNKIEERKFYYKNDHPICYTSKSFKPNSESPIIDSISVVYLKNIFRVEDGPTIRYFNKDGSLLRVFIKPSIQNFPSYVINTYDSGSKLISQSFKSSKFDSPPRNIFTYIIGLIKYAVEKPNDSSITHTEIISEFRTFNDLPINEILQTDSNFEITYFYNISDYNKNWTQFQVLKDGDFPVLTINCSIEYF